MVGVGFFLVRMRERTCIKKGETKFGGQVLLLGGRASRGLLYIGGVLVHNGVAVQCTGALISLFVYFACNTAYTPLL